MGGVRGGRELRGGVEGAVRRLIGKRPDAEGRTVNAHLRVARPTDDLDTLVAFYRDGVGFDVLTSFRDHDGFDGVMLGRPGAAYHLEFTQRPGHRARGAPSGEHLLVFYLPDEETWRAAVARLEGLGHRAVPAENPYWDRRGRTIADPDGYRVVLQNAAWPA